MQAAQYAVRCNARATGRAPIQPFA